MCHVFYINLRNMHWLHIFFFYTFPPDCIFLQNKLILQMWANAQRDGRPAEYRWRPLFNAAKFG